MAISEDDIELVREFVAESRDALEAVVDAFLALESDPGDPALIRDIFRHVHSIKGASSFLGLERIEKISHSAENLLGLAREGQLVVDENIVGVLLATVDALRAIFLHLEAEGDEGEDGYEELLTQLVELQQRTPRAQEGAAVAAATDAAQAPLSSGADDGAVPIGEVLLAAGHISRGDLDECAKLQEDGDGRDVGEILMSLGAVEHGVLSAALGDQTDDRPVKAEPKGGTLVPQETTIRVDLTLLDRIVGLVGELVLTRNQLVQATADGNESQNLGRRTQELAYITTALQEQALRTRMQRIENAWRSLPRVARDVARAADKRVRVEMTGEAIELDRTIIEAIRDPLVHLVRNAVDHGLEGPDDRLAAGKDDTGTVRLSAIQDGGHVIVEVADDGRGIDAARIAEAAVRKGIVTPEQVAGMREAEIIRLILAPGFSTASQVTTISGRGVGMDVVASNLHAIRGSLDVSTELGAGTAFRLTIPLTLAIVPALIITCSEQLFAIPQASVLELVRLHGEEIEDRIEWIHSAPVLRLRERLLPLLDLRSVLGLAPDADGESVTVVVVQSGDRPFGMLVDRVNKAEEIVVKPVSQTVQEYGTYAGATVMGDGSAALILDVASIARRSGITSQASSTPLQKARVLETDPTEYPVLTVKAAGRHVALPTSELERLETIQPGAVEWAGETPVVQYRGRMLPLVFVSELFGGYRDQGGETPLRVVVTSESRPRSVGLVVDHVLDVVNVERASLDSVGHGGAWAVIGSVVASGLVTELLDIPQIVAAYPGGNPEEISHTRHDDGRLAVA